MKCLATFLMLFFSTIIDAQIDFEFFQFNDTNKAKALIQLQIDTIEVNDDLVLRHYELEKTEIWDTTFINNKHYFVTKNTNINLLLPFGEIRTEYLVVKKAASIIEPINCDIECYEKITEQKEVLVKSYSWINENDLLNEKSWVLDTIAKQIIPISKYILKTPYPTKVIEIPIHYIKKKIFVPNRMLTKLEIETMESECKKQTLFPYKSVDYKRILKQEKHYSNQYHTYKIIKNGHIKLVEKLNKRELDKVIILLNKSLWERGYLVINTENLFDDFKRALVAFQIDNHLPIGQFDLATVNLLLN
jgi:hypothetical protein